jgi:hypothetical protein
MTIPATEVQRAHVHYEKHNHLEEYDDENPEENLLCRVPSARLRLSPAPTSAFCLPACLPSSPTSGFRPCASGCSLALLIEPLRLGSAGLWFRVHVAGVRSLRPRLLEKAPSVACVVTATGVAACLLLSRPDDQYEHPEKVVGENSRR